MSQCFLNTFWIVTRVDFLRSSHSFLHTSQTIHGSSMHVMSINSEIPQVFQDRQPPQKSISRMLRLWKALRNSHCFFVNLTCSSCCSIKVIIILQWSLWFFEIKADHRLCGRFLAYLSSQSSWVQRWLMSVSFTAISLHMQAALSNTPLL